jgi:transcriptional regulator with XRE-family HTH domain
MRYQETVQNLPLAIQRLRRRAGHQTQRAAIRSIQRKTGVRVTPTRYSDWEKGRCVPSLRSILAFLTGMGLGLRDLQDELDRIVGLPVAADAQPAPPSPPPAEEPAEDDSAALKRRLALLEERLAAVERRPPEDS